MNKIKIAYIIDYIFVDKAGTEKQLLGIIRRLDRTRFEPWIICLQKTPWLDSNQLPCDSFVLDYRGFLKWNFPLVLWSLASFLAANHFDIVQTFFEDSIFVSFMSIFVSRETPVLLTSRRDMGLGKSHPWYHSLFQIMMPLINRRTERVVANGENVKKYVMARESIPPEKIKVIYNGIDTNLYSGDTPEFFKRNKADFWIGITANINPVKRIDVFIQALSIVRKKCPDMDVKAVIMGDGAEREKMMNLRNGLGLENALFFLGSVQDIPAHLGCLHAAVLCSDREGLSNAILEYMVQGLPVVATSVGGNVELVDDVNGFLVPPGDPRALAESLLELIRNPEVRRQKGLNSRDKVTRLFSWDKAMREWQDFYQALPIRRG